METGRQTILLADDERSLRQALALIIEQAGFTCVEAGNGTEALALARSLHPDLVVLDVMMPGLDGFEVVERIRAFDQDLPILMLSAKADIVDKKTGFRLGADDYMAKPFNEEEFVLRLRALLRRRTLRARDGAGEGAARSAEATGAAASAASAGKAGEVGAAGPAADESRRLCIGDLAIDLLYRRVSIAGEPVALTPKEFDILATLASEPGRPFTPVELVGLIWGPDFTGDSISIPVYIRRLRKKMEPDPSDPVFIQTVHQVGYRLIAR